jgi:phage baseplate assembly protein W
MGFGTMPFGYGVFGAGITTTGSAPPTNTQASRYLDPITRDYEYDTTTRNLRRMSPVHQRIQLALMTLIGSSTTQPEWGIKLPRKITDRFPAQAEAAVRAALSRMTDVEKIIKVARVDVVTSGMRSRIIVHFVDLTTGRAGQETLNLG